jgi:hypothetical protein
VGVAEARLPSTVDVLSVGKALRPTSEISKMVTPVSFAEELLSRLGLPVTESNVRALVAFQNQEGGHENGARFNPLNTMLRTGDSVNFQSKKVGPGVQAYSSWDEGLRATEKTMRQGNMRAIFDSLRASASPADTIAAIAKSPWGWGSLPHSAADAIVRSSVAFERYGSKAYSGAGAFFGGHAFKYGAMGIVGVLTLGGLVLLGVGIKKKRDERRMRWTTRD